MNVTVSNYNIISNSLTRGTATNTTLELLLDRSKRGFKMAHDNKHLQ